MAPEYLTYLHSSITLTSNSYGHVLERRQRQRQVARAMDAALGG